MHREITALGGKKEVVLRQTPRAVTPFGGLSVWIEFLQKIGYRQQGRDPMPVRLKSPNAIDPGETFTAFLLAVVAGARRFAPTGLLRASAGPCRNRLWVEAISAAAHRSVWRGRRWR